jgi:6-phosphofructokinase 2
MPKFVTISLNPSIDVSSEADLVRPIHKTRTYNEVYSPGGGGVNVARVLTELGADVEVICPAGGVTGALLDELLEKAGVRRRLVPIAGTTRISLNVFERKTGQEYRFIPNGPKLSESEIAACLQAVRTSDCEYFVASGSVPLGAPPDILARIATIVRDEGARFVLDSSGIGLRGTLEHTPVFLVKPSHTEIEDLAGRRLDEESLVEAAADLVRRGRAERVAVTLGAAGAIFVTKDSRLRLWAPKVEARSAVGAGDSFLAAMLLAITEGRDDADTLAYAVAAGAAALLKPGSKLAHHDDVMRLYAELRGKATPVG